MANETTFALVSSLGPDIWEAALMFAQEQFVMPQLVTVFTDSMGWHDRFNSEYSQGTVVTGLGETTDLTTQALSRSLLGSLSPGEIGTQYIVTDRRLTDDLDQQIDVIADAGEVIGYSVFKQVEAHLVAQLGSLTAGTVGTAGSALTWQIIYNARSILAYNNVPSPYSVVLPEYAWSDLANVANIVGSSNAFQLRIRDEIQSRYYVGSVNDMDFYVKGKDVFTAGTAVAAGMFSRQAIALDIRRGFRIEPERDASLRSTELNATMVYGYGTWRASYGVRINTDASAP